MMTMAYIYINTAPINYYKKTNKLTSTRTQQYSCILTSSTLNILNYTAQDVDGDDERKGAMMIIWEGSMQAAAGTSDYNN